MKVNALKCAMCGDIVYSRARHDMRHCSCGAVAIDGGFDYCKLSYDPAVKGNELMEVQVEATKKQLYDDWNRMEDRFGLIKGESK